MTLDFSVLTPYLSRFLEAIGFTAVLSVSGFVISAVLAALLIPVRMSKIAAFKWAAWLYVEILRNVPILVVLYIVFFALPQIGIFTDAWIAAVVALSVNSTAYLVEIYRGGLNAIPRGRYEAAAALNLGGFTLWTRVLLPEALRMSYPAIGNQLVACVLGSSLAFFIGAGELTGFAYNVGSTTFRYFEAFITVTIAYIIVVQVVTFCWNRFGDKVILRDAKGARA